LETGDAITYGYMEKLTATADSYQEVSQTSLVVGEIKRRV